MYEGYHLDGRPVESEEWPGARALLKGVLVENEVLEIVQADGQRKTCWFGAVPIRAASGEIRGAVVVFRDITEERHMQAALRATQATLADYDRLNTIVNMGAAGVLTWEPVSGTLIDANDVFLQISGYTREQVDSGDITWRKLTAEEHMAESERQMARLTRTGRIGPYEKDLIHADGTRSPMLYAGSAISDRLVMEYCIDLSDRVSETPRNPL